MRRGWILLLLLAALALPVSAADVLEQERQILQVDSLTDPLSGQTREALEDYSPASQTDPASAILDIFKWASNLSVGTLREALQTGAMLGCVFVKLRQTVLKGIEFFEIIRECEIDDRQILKLRIKYTAGMEVLIFYT